MGALLGPRIKLVMAIAAVLCALWMLYLLRGILAPFVLAFVLAYVLTPVVDGMEARGLRRTPSILMIFLASFLLLGFGVVTLGKRMTEEMVDLYEDLLRSERVRSSVAITAGAGQALTLRAKTRSETGTNPFVILHPADGTLVLEPGERGTIQIEFAPRDVKTDSGALVLEGLTGGPHSIPLRGNLHERGEEKGAWGRSHGGPQTLGESTLSPGVSTSAWRVPTSSAGSPPRPGDSAGTSASTRSPWPPPPHGSRPTATS